MRKIENANIGVYGIYSPNGKLLYVGCSVELHRRYNEHYRQLISKNHVNRKLLEASIFYGVENLLFKTLILCDKTDLFYFENLFIKMFSPLANYKEDVKIMSDIERLCDSNNDYKDIHDYINSLGDFDKIKSVDILKPLEELNGKKYSSKKIGSILNLLGYKAIRTAYNGRVFFRK